MLRNIFLYTVRQHLLGVFIAAAALCAMMSMGIWVYAGIGEILADMIASMPPALLGMAGVEANSDSSTFVLSEITNLVSPLVLCGLTISAGVSSIAGEESRNTLAMLLGNPRSRRQVLLAKTLAMLVVASLSALLFYAGTEFALTLQSAKPSVHVGAVALHMGALAIFFGSFAIALGALTGRLTIATGGSVILLVISWLGSGLLPLFENAKEAARILPWYYFSASRPLYEGTSWSHVSVLFVASLFFLLLAFWGLEKRDLVFGDGTSLLEKLRKRLKGIPQAAKFIDALAGGSMTQNITLRSFSETQNIAMMVGFYTGLLAFAMGPLFNRIKDVLQQLSAAFPKPLMAMIGFADMSTPEGWFVAEVFSITAPAALIFVAVMMGRRALAGEEAGKTMGLLLANPISRMRIITEKAIAIAITLAAVTLLVVVGTVLANVFSDLGMGIANIFAVGLQLFALALFFGMLALCAGAASGKKSAVTYVSTGLALFAWAINAFMPVNPDLAHWAKLSPFHYAFGNNPLSDGLSIANTSVLLAGALALFALGAFLFNRRDLRG